MYFFVKIVVVVVVIFHSGIAFFFCSVFEKCSLSGVFEFCHLFHSFPVQLEYLDCRCSLSCILPFICVPLSQISDCLSLDCLHVFLFLLLTYLCPLLPVEHRPSTTPHHCTLFWAALVIQDQLVPCCFISASVSRLQLLRGRPLFLFPCGFQVRAWRVVLDAGFLRVCPIQPHFLCSICLATGSCPTHSYRSSFRIFSCHWIL